MPKTEARQQHNQQFNIQQIPQMAFDRLSPEQIIKMYKSTLQHIDSVDKRRFDFAVDQAQKKDAAGKQHVFIGGLLGDVGLICAYSLDSSRTDPPITVGEARRIAVYTVCRQRNEAPA